MEDNTQNLPAPAAPAFKIYWNGAEHFGQNAINIIGDRLERLEAGGGLSSNDVDSIRGLLRAYEERIRQLETQAGAAAGSLHQIIQTINLQATDIARLSLQVQAMQPYQGAAPRSFVQQVPGEPAPAPAAEEKPLSVCPLCGFFSADAELFNDHMRAGDHPRKG